MLIYLDIKIPHLQIAHLGGNLEVGNIKIHHYEVSQKKNHSHNFRIWASKFKSLVAIVYGNKWFTFGSSNSKILGDTFFVTPKISFFFFGK